MVETVDDIFAEIEPIIAEIRHNVSESDAGIPVSGAPLLDKDYEILLDALGFEPAGLDSLVVRTGLEAGAMPRCC